MTRIEKGRTWAGVAYPESVELNWLDVLDETHLDILVSPLHDKDVNPDGTVKKPHWHILVMWDNPTTKANAERLFEEIGAVMDPLKVESVAGYARYLLHLDNPEKHQYPRNELKVLGSCDYEDLIQKTQTRRRDLKTLLRFIRYNNITSLSVLFDYIDKNGLDNWLSLLVDTHTRAITALIQSNYWTRVHLFDDGDYELVDPETGEITIIENQFKGEINHEI